MARADSPSLEGTGIRRNPRRLASACQGSAELTAHLDDAIIERFRSLSEETGKGYQTLINEALRGLLNQDEAPLTADTVRKIVREELAHGESVADSPD